MAVVTDKTYYRELGRRIAERRKALGITQVQLAEQLGIAQQTMAPYEGGTLRVAVALLPPLARSLDLSFEELVDSEDKPTLGRGKRGPAPKIKQQLEQIEALPKAKQRAIAQVLDSMLGQDGADGP
ncbi:helix-turn-helix domain-containing protein [Lysobacter cavernae]|uniref:Helix-turn-helix domain-containing protein n=1 Tax=Lysobacter cavernae TaxID=1685901 RepID=A0ABV7RLF8_9GAMM